MLAIAAAKQPSDRYPTVGAFALALRAAFEGGTTIHTTPDRCSLPHKPLQRTAGVRRNRHRRLLRARTPHRRTQRDHLDDPDSRLLAIVGPSGSGKSSVVRAGLIPAIRNNRLRGSSNWFTTTMIPGARPFEALETALLRVAVNPPNALLDQLRTVTEASSGRCDGSCPMTVPRSLW